MRLDHLQSLKTMGVVKVAKGEAKMKIEIQDLMNGQFCKYGEAICVPTGQKPDSSGEGWDCWYPLSSLNQNHDYSFGVVLSTPKFQGTQYLERHLDREELVVALDQPIIQVVGMSDPDKPECPDIDQTEAFLIQPGQIVRINPGVWHSAGLAIEGKSCLYLFLLGKPTKNDSLVDSGLVKFSSGDCVTVG